MSKIKGMALALVLVLICECGIPAAVEPQVVAPTATPSPPPSEQEKMDAVLSVAMTRITNRPKNTALGRHYPRADLLFKCSNAGPVAIRAFTGVFYFVDMFGRSQQSLVVTVEQTIPAGAGIAVHGYGFDINEHSAADQWLATTALADMTVLFELDAIIFHDGTRLGKAR